MPYTILANVKGEPTEKTADDWRELRSLLNELYLMPFGDVTDVEVS